MLAFLVCLGVVAGLLMIMYKRWDLFKKKEAGGNYSVSFHGNVVSFSNPVLDDPKTASLVGYQILSFDEKTELLCDRFLLIVRIVD